MLLLGTILTSLLRCASGGSTHKLLRIASCTSPHTSAVVGCLMGFHRWDANLCRWRGPTYWLLGCTVDEGPNIKPEVEWLMSDPPHSSFWSTNPTIHYSVKSVNPGTASTLWEPGISVISCVQGYVMELWLCANIFKVFEVRWLFFFYSIFGLSCKVRI